MAGFATVPSKKKIKPIISHDTELQSYDRYIRKSYASQDGWSERETKVLRSIIHPVINSSDWKIQINKVTFFKVETVFGDSL